MIISKYNYFYTINGINYVFNSLSESIIEFPNETEDPEHYINTHSDYFKKYKVLCSSEKQEHVILEKKRKLISQNVNKDINIEVTNKCNLSCEGCFNKLNYGERIDSFEKLRNSFENSIEYLKYEYQKNKIMSISISISGGEPLLFVERISELSKICKMNLTKEIYTFRILTNGTLFTDQNISLLCSLDNIEFYISVDNYRYMFISNEKNAHANFKKLKENILLIYKYTKKRLFYELM